MTRLALVLAAAVLALEARTALACTISLPVISIHGQPDGRSPPAPRILGHHVERGYVVFTSPGDNGANCGLGRGRDGRVTFDLSDPTWSGDVGYLVEIVAPPSPPSLAPPDWITPESPSAVIYLEWPGAEDDVIVDVTVRVRAVDEQGDMSEWSEPYRVRDEGTVGCGAAGGDATGLVGLLLLLRRRSAPRRS